MNIVINHPNENIDYDNIKMVFISINNMVNFSFW